MFDPDAYRDESRRRWETAAAGWEKRRATMQQGAQAVSVAMIDLLAPQPGQTLLELAAGVADTGLLAAELVEPGGKVIITDQAEAMVEAARRRAEELGITNVELRPMDAEWLDLETASVHGVLSRWGYMLLADPEAALRETRRVLRRGGKVVLAAWADPEGNPWMTSIARTMVEHGHAEKPPADEPGPFAFAAEGRIEEILDAAGFGEVRVEPVDFSFTFESTDSHWEHQMDMSTRLKDQVAPLTPAEHTKLRDAIDEKLAPYVRPDGSVELPARTWVAKGVA